MIKRIIYQFIGATLMSLGVSVTLNTNLGAFPYDANNWFIHTIFSDLLSLEVVIFLAGCILTVINIIFYKDLKKSLALVIVLLMSILIGVFNYLLGFINIHEHLIVSIPVSILGILILAIGTNFIIIANLIKSPIEDIMLLLHKKIKDLFVARLLLETLFLISAIITGLIAGILFEQINIFTAVCMFGISTFIAWTHPFVLFITRTKNERNEKQNEA